jgi:hypothetical protein
LHAEGNVAQDDTFGKGLADPDKAKKRAFRHVIAP